MSGRIPRNPLEAPVSIFVPKSQSIQPTNLAIAKGSAIVAWPLAHPDDLMEVYFEGNIFNDPNLDRFAVRCLHAHGRLAQRYPTIARGFIDENDLIHVGYWYPIEKVVEVRNMEALTEWCDWTLPISASVSFMLVKEIYVGSKN